MAEEPVEETPIPHASRNFWLTVLNGGIGIMGTTFFSPGTVLAALTTRLTGSAFCVGLVISVAGVGWMWPQIFVANLIEPLRRKLPVYVALAFVRFFLLIAMAATLFLWKGSPVALFWIILGLYGLLTSSGGVVGLPFMDIVAKTIRPKDQPLLWSYRRVMGGLCGFLAGLMVAFVLSERSGLAYPANYAALMVMGALFCGVAYFMFARVKEPVEERTTPRVSFMTFLRRGPVIFRKDKDFRRFFLLRSAWALTAMSQHALFVMMAIRYFGASDKVAGGWFTALILLIGGLSSFIWGWATRRFGERRVMQTSSVLHLCGLGTALLLALMHFYEPTAPFAARYYLVGFAVMFACGTAAINASDIVQMVYILALPPAGLRPTYLAFLNALYVPMLFAPSLAGFLADLTAFPVVFVLSMIAAVIAFILAGRLSHRHEANAPEFEFAGE